MPDWRVLPMAWFFVFGQGVWGAFTRPRPVSCEKPSRCLALALAQVKTLYNLYSVSEWLLS